MKDIKKENNFLELLPRITLKRRKSERENSNHPWIFSNEIADAPKKIERAGPSALVEVLNCHGDYLGTGIYHAHSLIAIRLLTKNRTEQIDTKFFSRRIASAIKRRDPWYGEKTSSQNTYRAVFGESDGLPGFIIDRFNNTWVMQFHSLGMWDRRMDLVEALQEVAPVDCVIGKTNVQSGNQEKLEKHSQILFGEIPSKGVFATENNIHFPVDVLSGQKTGFYFDQRENRKIYISYLQSLLAQKKNIRVADIYSHIGTWGILALAAGAQHVTFIDTSESALETLKEIIKAHGWENRCEIICGDVKEKIKDLEKNSYDFISLDPPSFIPNKKSIPAGLKAYSHINQMAALLLKENGILASASCSHNCTEEKFLEVVAKGILKSKKNLTLLHRGGAAFDHPALPSMPETIYLKNLFFQTW